MRRVGASTWKTACCASENWQPSQASAPERSTSTPAGGCSRPSGATAGASACTSRPTSPGSRRSVDSRPRGSGAQGLRLDEITHLLTTSGQDDHSTCAPGVDEACPADPRALEENLAAMDAQMQTLRAAADRLSPDARGAMAGLVARARVLIATAAVLGQELLSGSQLLPPM